MKVYMSCQDSLGNSLCYAAGVSWAHEAVDAIWAAWQTFWLKLRVVPSEEDLFVLIFFHSLNTIY